MLAGSCEVVRATVGDIEGLLDMQKRNRAVATICTKSSHITNQERCWLGNILMMDF